MIYLTYLPALKREGYLKVVQRFVVYSFHFYRFIANGTNPPAPLVQLLTAD